MIRAMILPRNGNFGAKRPYQCTVSEALPSQTVQTSMPPAQHPARLQSVTLHNIMQVRNDFKRLVIEHMSSVSIAFKSKTQAIAHTYLLRSVCYFQTSR